MTSAPKRRLQALSEQLVVPPTDPGTFETIPKIRHIAPSSPGPRFQSRVAIITGANSPLGIGRATAHQFAQNGARAIYICDYNDQYLGVHERELKSLYPETEVHARKFDAADEAAMKAVVEEAVGKYGRLDVMFANAGVSGSNRDFRDVGAAEVLGVLRTNVVSVFVAAKYAAQAMKKTSKEKPYPSGSIIATASVAGLRSNAGATDYSASKAAVISIMQTTAYQLSGTGIRCNAICPGLIETGMTASMYDAARAKGSERRIGQLNPMQRGGLADEVASVVSFLGSAESSYVNGQAWAVDGGLSAGHPTMLGKMA